MFMNVSEPPQTVNNGRTTDERWRVGAAWLLLIME
jgi:hypothetical protein